jgi:hypothetical protein
MWSGFSTPARRLSSLSLMPVMRAMGGNESFHNDAFGARFAASQAAWRTGNGGR